jgi:small-conductance mechanosensitive channel
MGNLTFRFVSFLFPIALFVVAMIGIAGYLSLAGFIARYMGIFLAILLGWGIAESLLTHWSAAIKNRIGSAYGANTPLIRDFVDLIHRILSVLLLLVAGFLLYRSYDWKTEYIVSNWEALLVAVLSVIIAYEVIFFLASHYIRRTRQRILQSLVQQSKKPMGVILPLAAAQIVITKTTLPGETIEFLLHALVLAQIAAISWLILSMVAVVDKYAEQRYFEDTRDKMAARRIRTQARVLRRIVAVGVYILAIAAMLMTFPTVRQLGAGLLASAGAAGLIIGIAARPLFENLIAGMQIGLAQPIRIDDHVIVENEWGRIEEINSTYVVVHIWDDRRLIVPLNYFNTQPFQNWTLTGSTLIGSVFVYVDYTFPMEEGRKELKRILDSTDLWDGNVWVLQVTDASEQTMELRALMTAKDAPTAWDLRCYVREHFIAFIQRNHPDCLPKARASVKRDKRTTGSETLGFPGIVQNG